MKVVVLAIACLLHSRKFNDADGSVAIALNDYYVEAQSTAKGYSSFLCAHSDYRDTEGHLANTNKSQSMPRLAVLSG